MRRRRAQLQIRNARLADGRDGVWDVEIEGGAVASVNPAGTGTSGGIDLDGRMLLPGFVNGHDHLDFSTFPPLGQPPYASVYEWAADVNGGADAPAVKAALAVPLVDRLFLGGLRNLLAGSTAVAHHNPYHRSLGRREFPVRVLARYGFAHSPGLTPALRKTYRTTDRRVPWMVHVAEGTDERCRRELHALEAANVLRQNTVIVHGIGLAEADMPRIAAARAVVVWCPESNRKLYDATAAVAALRAAGVGLGLGSDSPVSGVRDPLSNLAAARAEGVFTDDELLALATRDTAAAARLPVGGFEAGDPADFVACRSAGGLLSGDRRALALVVVAGEALYGEPSLLSPERSAPVTVDGVERRLDAELRRRAAAVLREHPIARQVPWLVDLDFG